MDIGTLAKQLGILFALAATLALPPAHAQETVYFDDFSGAGGALNGTTPDTSLTGGSWAAGSTILDNGTIGADDFTALLPFQPAPNFIYELSADFNAIGTANQWVAMGFTQGQQGDLNQRFINGSEPALWALSRSDGSTSADVSFLGFPGGNTTGAQDAPTSSADRIVLTLDTTGLEWVWTVDFGDDGVDRTETVTAIPNINFVALSSTSSGLSGSTFDNFMLTREAFPINEWDANGGGSFNTSGNWSEGSVPGAGETVLFGAAHATETTAEVTLDAPVTLGQVRFSNANPYNITGPSTLTLNGSASLAPTLGTHEISAPIAGSAGLAKASAGTVVLSNGANSYTGDTVISNGTLGVAHINATNQASGVVDVAAGATLQFTGDGAGNGATGVWAEEITGAGAVALAAPNPNAPESPGLTTEVISFSTANPSFTGGVSVNGGTLSVADPGALGAADGTPETGTSVAGGQNRGTLHLPGVTVTGERLGLLGRQPTNDSPHLSSAGTSSWNGAIVGGTGGNSYTIESQSGTLTLPGDIMLPDSDERILHLTGAGDGIITGQIIDQTVAAGDGAENASTSLIKQGAGTWTIATTPPIEDPGASTASDAYHQRRTVIEEGTLAVQATGSTAGELFSRSIEIRSGATFDVSSFTEYSLQILEDPDATLSSGDEVGQTLAGAGTVNVGGTLQSFDDSSLAPGDSVGQLTLNGNFRHDTFADTPAGEWNYELGDTTAAGDSDLFRIVGAATINAGSSSNAILVNVSPVEGTLASGSYTLVQADSLALSGSAGNGTYVEAVLDSQGNDITAGMRQTVAAANSGNNVVLNVTGTAANLDWAGTSGSAWDVKSTNNWTGTGGPQFNQLDNVTFGNVANKNVAVNESVAPGSVTFSGGAGSTYTVTGSGGMTGFGDVDVDSGTVRLQNSGNSYAGATTVAAGARLEIDTASTGSIAVNGTLSLGGDGVVTGGAQTFFTDDFSGAGGALNGATPDTTTFGAQWVAAPFIQDDGGIGSAGSGGSATLAFTPLDGSTYVLETSLSSVSGDNDWIGLGFANGQSEITGLGGRFINGDVIGAAWAMIRGDASSDANQTFLGNAEGTSGLGDAANWIASANQSGGDVTLRITLDTTGGDGAWTATMEADLGSGFQVIREADTLLTQDINSIGIPVSRPNDTTGTIESFSLTGVEPADARYDGQTININGDLVMGSTGVLELDFALFGQDSINVTGEAMLDGTIDVTKLGDFTPSAGEEYTLLSAAGGITDLGVTFNLPSNFTASIVDMTSLVITFGAGLSGDFNGDGIVDSIDYAVWRENLGSPDESVLNNNGDGLGGVDQGDFDLWLANYGASLGAGADNFNATVPEPSSLMWCLLLFLGRLLGRRRLAACPTTR